MNRNAITNAWSYLEILFLIFCFQLILKTFITEILHIFWNFSLFIFHNFGQFNFCYIDLDKAEQKAWHLRFNRKPEYPPLKVSVKTHCSKSHQKAPPPITTNKDPRAYIEKFWDSVRSLKILLILVNRSCFFDFYLRGQQYRWMLRKRVLSKLFDLSSRILVSFKKTNGLVFNRG